MSTSVALIESFITHLTVIANPDIEAEQLLPPEAGDLRFHIESGADNSQKDSLVMALEVGLEEEAADRLPYQFEATIHGQFRKMVPPGIPAALVEGYQSSEAATMLLAALREMVAMVSGRGPYPPLILPHVNFGECFLPQNKPIQAAKTTKTAAKSSSKGTSAPPAKPGKSAKPIGKTAAPAAKKPRN
jgi:preprotein translocase subunit SecB